MGSIEKRARIEYPQEQASQPLLYPLSRSHRVRINIRRASITEDGGFLEVDLSGEEDDVAAVLANLRDTGCQVHEKD